MLKIFLLVMLFQYYIVSVNSGIHTAIDRYPEKRLDRYPRLLVLVSLIVTPLAMWIDLTREFKEAVMCMGKNFLGIDDDENENLT